MDKKRVISIDVSLGTMDNFLREIDKLCDRKESSYVCVANVHMLVEAYKRRSFAKVVNSADIVTPDGMPLVWALRLLYGIKQDRIAGPDLMPLVLEMAENNNRSVFLYGSTREVLESLVAKVKINFPKLKIAGYISPPFRKLTKEEDDNVVCRINEASPDIILVSLGCPKQEMWMAQMKGRVKSVMIGVGAAFPIYADFIPRAPVWMQRMGMEWLFRLTREPTRLWKRYLFTNTMFMGLLLYEMLKKGIKR